jgi:hypothetical protein
VGRKAKRRRALARRKEIRRAVVELLVATMLLVIAGLLAADYLLPPQLRVAAASASPNVLHISVRSELSSADAMIMLDEGSYENLVAGFTPINSEVKQLAATLEYRVAGLGGADSVYCIDASGARIDVRADMAPVDISVPLGNLAGWFSLDCTRDQGVVIPDRRGEVVVIPTDITVEDSNGEPPLSIDRIVDVPSEWTFASVKTSYGWHELRESGTAAYSDSESHLVEPFEVQGRPTTLRFVDHDAAAASERNAWISALVAGTAAGLLTTGLSGLIRGTRWRNLAIKPS